MNNYIKNVKIANLFGEKNVDWNLNKVNVLVGKNGLGKSTILRLINSASTLKPSPELKFSDDISIFLNNGKSNTYKKDIVTYKKMFSEVSNTDGFTELIELIITEQLKDRYDVQAKYDVSSELINDLSHRVLKKLNSGLENVDSYNIASNLPLGYISHPAEAGELKTEFVSTINLSANSINTVTKSTGEHTTLLDIEIESELKRLTDNISKNNEKELGSKFEDALNNFFKETGKKVKFIDDQLIITLENDKTLSFKHLSSGERQIIFIFLKVINGSVDRSLILMDEPEISLHLSWQEKLLDEITKVNNVSQIIIVTHSPAIVMNGWFDCLTDIDSIFTKNINNTEAI